MIAGSWPTRRLVPFVSLASGDFRGGWSRETFNNGKDLPVSFGAGGAPKLTQGDKLIIELQAELSRLHYELRFWD